MLQRPLLRLLAARAPHHPSHPSLTHSLTGGAIDCVRKTLQWEGVAGLYKGVISPLAGQMFFRATLFSAFGAAKRWLGSGTGPDGSPVQRPLVSIDYFKAGAMTGAAAAFVESPIDFYKSQIQVQMVRAKADPTYKGECEPPRPTPPMCTVVCGCVCCRALLLLGWG